VPAETVRQWNPETILSLYTPKLDYIFLMGSHFKFSPTLFDKESKKEERKCFDW